MGAAIVVGDLKDPASLDAACRGATAVCSTASSTLSQQAGDSIETVDGAGQIALVDAAARAGVGTFVLISFPSAVTDFPLQSAKRAAEDRLQRSGVPYTILQPTFFSEVWLSPALGFDPANGTARIYGAGDRKISWISFRDVAAFAAAAMVRPATNGRIKLGGPEALSPLEVIGLAESIAGRSIAVQHVPEDALRAQLASATDSLQKSFAGLMLYYANGDVIDMRDAMRVLPVPPLRSVRDHLQPAH
jgi:uncharacterized protein YbjT (DUF2867 family)